MIKDSFIFEGITSQVLQQRNSKLILYLNHQKNQILLKLLEQKQQLITQNNKYQCCLQQLQKGLEMFVQASKNLLDVYFPILMDRKYLDLMCQRQINQKLTLIKLGIEKNWNFIYKQLVKPKQEIEFMKKRFRKQDKRKVKNSKIPAEAATVLQKWLLQNFNDPYPSYTKKIEMAKQSNLSVYQVNNWFINARQRVVKKFLKKQSLRNLKQDQYEQQ